VLEKFGMNGLPAPIQLATLEVMGQAVGFRPEKLAETGPDKKILSDLFLLTENYFIG